MLALKARVRNGRLVLDEPTALPEGAEVRIALVDADDFEERDRAALEAALEEGEAEIAAGQVVSEADLWLRLATVR